MESLAIQGRKEQTENGEEEVVRKVNLKYEGTNSTLMVDFNRDFAIMQREFAAEHKTRYGFIQEEKSLIVESVSVELIQKMDTPDEPVITRTRPIDIPPPSIETVKMFASEQWHDAKVYLREDLQPEDSISGAAIIVEPINTIIIEPDWQVTINELNCLILERIK